MTWLRKPLCLMALGGTTVGLFAVGQTEAGGWMFFATLAYLIFAD